MAQTKAPWVKWYPSDFLNGVVEMEPNELAVYVIVLNRIYDENGPIPCDIERIAKRCHMRPSSCSKALDALVEHGKLILADGRLSNNRAEKEMKSRQEVRDKSAISATTRWEKSDGKPNENNDENMRTQSERIANALPTRSQKLEPESIKKEDSSLRSLGEPVDPDELDLAFGDWNTLASHSGLPKATTLTAKRKAALRQRLKECGGRDGWQSALRLIPQSPFLMGENNSGFTATLDFVLQASSFTKLREGNYAKRGNGPAQKTTSADAFGDLAEFYRAQAIREGEDSRSVDGPVQDVPKLAHHRA